MGYTIAAPCKSEKQKRKMLDFLNANWRSWKEIGGTGQGGTTRPLGCGLSYDRSHHRIGFNYNAFGGEREYAFATVRWIALRVGKKATKNKLPYYVNDGCENISILTEGPTPENESNQVDEFGVPVYDANHLNKQGVWTLQHLLEAFDEPDALDRMRAELKRLDVLWKSLPE